MEKSEKAALTHQLQFFFLYLLESNSASVGDL